MFAHARMIANGEDKFVFLKQRVKQIDRNLRHKTEN